MCEDDAECERQSESRERMWREGRLASNRKNVRHQLNVRSFELEALNQTYCYLTIRVPQRQCNAQAQGSAKTSRLIFSFIRAGFQLGDKLLKTGLGNAQRLNQMIDALIIESNFSFALI